MKMPKLTLNAHAKKLGRGLMGPLSNKRCGHDGTRARDGSRHGITEPTEAA